MNMIGLRGLALAALAALGTGCGEGRQAADADLYVEFDAGPDATASDAMPEAPMLRVDYLDPDHGPFTGGTEVVIRGRGFVPGMSIEIGGRAVEELDILVIDDRRVSIRTPPGDPGPADVDVAANGLTATLDDGFFYESITVDPPSGAVAGGTFVRVIGFETSFQTGDVVTFDGEELVGATVVSEQEITGFTPPGVPGDTDVVVAGAAGTIEAKDAYVYTNTSDPFNGGLGGGPIDGTINITVVDAMTSDGVDGAFVSVGDPASSPFTGYTDPFGQITFSGPLLVAPVSVVAAAAGYETSAFVVFDATDVTIFLVPIPEPQPGPLPPGRAAGYVSGHILFGDATGIGTENWGLVPEPRTATEFKRAYVFTTLRDPFSGNPDPGLGGIVDYVDDGSTSWDYQITARPAALAVYAVAGLFDPAVDPDGSGPNPPGMFTPFALGVARGILVGPGENVENVAVVVDIPLDTSIVVDLDQPPPLNTPGWYGPTEYQTQAFIDLGGEGVLALPGNRATLPPGATSGALPSQAPLISSIADGSYTVFAGAYSAFGGNPFSVRVERGVTDVSLPLIIGDFLGTPRPVDPPNGGTASYQHLEFAPEGAVTGEATFNLHILGAGDGTPLWRIFTAGDQFDVPLWNVVDASGTNPIPTDAFVFWTLYEITLAGGVTFDNFNYGHLNANYWSAYAADAWAVRFPAP